MSLRFQLKKISDLLNKVSVFYSHNSANYWHTVTPCRISSPPDEIGAYFLDFSSKADYVQSLDENGVPLFEYGGEIPSTYHPVAICQYALGLSDIYFETGCLNENIKNKFLIQADWLRENAVIRDGGTFWLFDFPDKRYKINAPWFSAMAQGEAISVLCRAFKITDNKDYLTTAAQALMPFNKKIAEGGVKNVFENLLLFEEYPAGEVTGVLNGFIFSLFGLYDLYLVCKNEEAYMFFNEGIESLKKLLKYYDLGYWSRYDLFKYPLVNPASYTYHELHVQQLKALYVLTGEKVLLEFSKKWHGYEKGLIRKTKALINKIIYFKKVDVI